jgi:hypothetical protein
MNSFQRKSLYAALAGAGALGMTATANAVSVNPNGLGQVLIYPYYTVQSDAAGNAYNSLLSVVNTDSSAKAVKVRFLEGRNSREVLDFNLFLSKFDVWTAGIVPTTGGGGARVITVDKSCTIPGKSDWTSLGGGAFSKDFVNFGYVGDGGGDGLDRTKEGYVEMILMASYTSTNCTSIVVTHVGGSPLCQSAKHPLSDPSARNDASGTTGGLFGGMTLINVGSGTAYTEDAVALEKFNQPLFGGGLYTDAGSVLPTLADSGPKISVVFNGLDYTTGFNIDGTIRFQFNYEFESDYGIYWASWSGPECLNSATGAAVTCNNADPVSAVLMHNQVMNEYVLDAATKSGTDFVITFPTKRFYVGVGTGAPAKLFQKNFNKTAFSCDDIIINIFDREESTTTTPQSFSPPIPGAAPTSLCYEANVLTFNNTNVLGSKNSQSLTTTFADGWLDLHLSSGTNLVTYHKLVNTRTVHSDVTFGGSAFTATWQGLPVVGFAVQSFTNGTLVVGGTNVLANYGGNFGHRYTTLIN